MRESSDAVARQMVPAEALLELAASGYERSQRDRIRYGEQIRAILQRRDARWGPIADDERDGDPDALLRRTRVGGFGLGAAHPLADLEARQGEPMPVTPLAEAARAAFAVREVDEAEARTLGFGQRLASAVPGRTEPVAAIAPDGTLVAMLDESRPTARSLVVFSPATS